MLSRAAHLHRVASSTVDPAYFKGWTPSQTLTRMQAPRSVSCVLQPLITLWALRRVECTMGWLILEGLIPLTFAKEVSNHIR